MHAPLAAAVDLDAWDAWTPQEALRSLQPVEAPWYVAGGWALDLYLGEVTRAHDDLEIGVREQDADHFVAALPQLEAFVVGDGAAWPWRQAQGLRREHHQTWLRERGTHRWRVDLLREPAQGDTWIARRDARIRLPRQHLIERTAQGIPYGRPEVILLFKAKAARAEDQGDFDRVLPRLDASRRHWLREALALAHPGHAWIAALA